MLLYFILGILFISLGLPIIQNLLSIFTSFTEYIVYLFAFKVFMIKQAISETNQEEQSQDTKAIGFKYRDDEEQEWDE